MAVACTCAAGSKDTAPASAATGRSRSHCPWANHEPAARSSPASTARGLVSDGEGGVRPLAMITSSTGPMPPATTDRSVVAIVSPVPIAVVITAVLVVRPSTISTVRSRRRGTARTPSRIKSGRRQASTASASNTAASAPVAVTASRWVGMPKISFIGPPNGMRSAEPGITRTRSVEREMRAVPDVLTGWASSAACRRAFRAQHYALGGSRAARSAGQCPPTITAGP